MHNVKIIRVIRRADSKYIQRTRIRLPILHRNGGKSQQENEEGKNCFNLIKISSETFWVLSWGNAVKMMEGKLLQSTCELFCFSW